MTARRSVATALAAAAACSVLLAACAAPANQAEPPASSSSVVFSPSVSAGPPITVPELSSSVSSPPPAPVETPTPTPSSEEPAPAPAPEPEPEPEPVITAEPPQIDDPGDDFQQTEEPQEPAAPAPAPAPAVSGGRVVVIDPGHNGANGANPSIINALVDAGFGDTKPCNTTGTATNAGYPEHAFTWGVAMDLKSLLEAQGVTVIMTRDSDDGVGPCVDRRAAIGNQANADAVVSIHGDGVENDSDTGFYVMTAERDPAGSGVAAQSAALAGKMRDGLVAAGLSPSNYLGSNGLWERGDLAGLNLSTRPTVMIESGNMRAPSDAALMSSDSGQAQFAQGYANGILAFLGG